MRGKSGPTTGRETGPDAVYISQAAQVYTVAGGQRYIEGPSRARERRASVVRGIVGLLGEEPPLGAFAAEDGAPEGVGLRLREEILGDGGDDPRVLFHLVFQLAGSPAAISQERADLRIFLAQQLDCLLGLDAEVKAKTVFVSLPGGEDELFRVNGTALEERHAGEWAEGEIAVELTEAAIDGPVENDAHGALAVMNGHEHHAAAEIGIAQHGMGDQQGTRERFPSNPFSAFAHGGQRARSEFQDFDTRLGQQRFDEGVIGVILTVFYFRNSGGGENFGAADTGEMCYISDAALDGAAAAGGVGHGVLLGVDRGLLVAVADARLVWRARQKAIITRCHEAVFAGSAGHDDAPDVQSFAIRAGRHQYSGGHEIFIPAGAVRKTFRGVGDEVNRAGWLIHESAGESGQVRGGRQPSSEMMARQLQPELLDTLSPQDPVALHNRRDLRWTNKVMGNHRWLAQKIRQHLPAGAKALELGAGDGEFGRALIARGTAVDGLDLWPRPDDWPRERAWFSHDLKTFARFDEYPLIFGNLIFHQFSGDELATLGSALRGRAHILIACEPARWRRSQIVFQAMGRLLVAHPVTLHDGHVSIAAGFLGDELPHALGLPATDWRWRCETTALGAYHMIAIRRG